MPSEHIWYESINPLIEEFLTSETHKHGCDIDVERGCANIFLGRYLLRSTRYPHHTQPIAILNFNFLLPSLYGTQLQLYFYCANNINYMHLTICRERILPGTGHSPAKLCSERNIISILILVTV
jgi:hypothetical protein